MALRSVKHVLAFGAAAGYLALGAVSAANAAPVEQEKLGLPSEGPMSSVPLSDLAGGAESNLAGTISNPDPSAVEAGRQLYVKLNCADCHGFEAKGAMGPALVDKFWRYGGTPAAIYKSIFEGRPKGMPAWGKALSSTDIWQIVAYIESLGGTYSADFYQRSLQGDREHEQVAPELNFEQELDGSPKYDIPLPDIMSGLQSPAPEQKR